MTAQGWPRKGAWRLKWRHPEKMSGRDGCWVRVTLLLSCWQLCFKHKEQAVLPVRSEKVWVFWKSSDPRLCLAGSRNEFPFQEAHRILHKITAHEIIIPAPSRRDGIWKLALLCLETLWARVSRVCEMLHLSGSHRLGSEFHHLFRERSSWFNRLSVVCLKRGKKTWAGHSVLQQLPLHHWRKVWNLVIIHIPLIGTWSHVALTVACFMFVVQTKNLLYDTQGLLPRGPPSPHSPTLPGFCSRRMPAPLGHILEESVIPTRLPPTHPAILSRQDIPGLKWDPQRTEMLLGACPWGLRKPITASKVPSHVAYHWSLTVTLEVG